MPLTKITSSGITNDAITADKIASGTITTAKIANDAVTSAKIANDTIANADINSSAAIAYSKLNLATSIANADISSSAAIAYSKLNLGTSITSSDLASTFITGATSESTIAGGDQILIYDDSTGALRKMTRTNFVSGVGGVNTPAFLANTGGGYHEISSSTNTKIPFTNEVFDTNNNYSTINYRFTPTTAGKYFLKTACTVYAPNNDLRDFRIGIYKNGSKLSSSYNLIFVSSQDLRHCDITTSYIDTANGSSDYYEVYVYAVCTTPRLQADSEAVAANNFFGYKIIE